MGGGKEWLFSTSLYQALLWHFLFLKICLFVYLFWPHWIFIAVHRFSLVAASRGYSVVVVHVSHCGGFSCCGAQPLGAQASVVVMCGLICCGSWAWLLCSLWDLLGAGINQTHVPSTCRWILNHWTSREALY